MFHFVFWDAVSFELVSLPSPLDYSSTNAGVVYANCSEYISFYVVHIRFIFSYNQSFPCSVSFVSISSHVISIFIFSSFLFCLFVFFSTTHHFFSFSIFFCKPHTHTHTHTHTAYFICICKMMRIQIKEFKIYLYRGTEWLYSSNGWKWVVRFAVMAECATNGEHYNLFT